MIAAKNSTISTAEANAHLTRLGHADGLPSLVDDLARQIGHLGSAKKVM